jgi:dienelactone hydrolase
MRLKMLLLTALFFFPYFSLTAQKKSLDHSVYDGWQSIGEKGISNKGQWVYFTVNVQEGDGTLFIKDSSGKSVAMVPRGYNASFSPGQQNLVCRIRAPFSAIREARIKKKKPEEMPKDSLAIVQLSSGAVIKVAGVKQYAFPETGSSDWLVYWLEKQPPPIKEINLTTDSLTRLNNWLRLADSLAKASDSIRKKANELTTNGLASQQVPIPSTSAPPSGVSSADPTDEGTDLMLVNLSSIREQRFSHVTEWLMNKNGSILIYEQSKKAPGSNGKNTIHRVQLTSMNDQTIFKGFFDAKSYVMDENAQQMAFIADRDTSSKAVQRVYQLWYFKAGTDSARLLVHSKIKGVPTGFTVAENTSFRGDMGLRRNGSDAMFFSKSGQQLFFGLSAILPPKDTSLPEFERVNVDIWHFKDDQIQPAQLRNLAAEINRSYLARYDFDNHQVVPLANPNLRNVIISNEGDGKNFYATSDSGHRIAAQWQGFTLNDLYHLNPFTGKAILIKKQVKANLIDASPGGNYLIWYDEAQKTYFSFNAPQQKLTAFAKDIPYALYDEENDVPDDANAEGIVKWTEDERFLFLYDRYDLWKVDPTGKEKSVRITNGRNKQIQYRFINTDRDEKFFTSKSNLLLRVFDEKDKSSGLAFLPFENNLLTTLFKEPVWVGPAIVKSKESSVFLFTKETFQQSPNLFIKEANSAQRQLSFTNPQQAAFNWGSASLFKWRAYTGRMTEGVLYRPENFDSTKKYPMIVYFYERNNATLHNYIPPAPTPSRLNIPFYVSRGYVVFVPDIWYNKGYPGQGAYDHILSGTRAVVKEGYVDSNKVGLQGQSWGGYQIAYLITKTPLYRAAWAGAPVANMTSAYGGIRWGPGILRQFQYEKSQSRIGATLWEKPELYIKNSPLFSLTAVTTPLVIMANDADDAVPWYQGIELFAGLRRLGKQVWLLNYNNEVHNLAERKNRKDIQIRQQQFFDYLLKDATPAKWIKEGVPAVMKGRDLGLGQ